MELGQTRPVRRPSRQPRGVRVKCQLNEPHAAYLPVRLS
jgi:hypothetical protein